jgi:RNA-binding protein 8A
MAEVLSEEEDFQTGAGSGDDMETGKSSKKAKKKGRGFSRRFEEERFGGKFDKVKDQDDDKEVEASGAQKSVEGWIVFITGVHEEAQEDDIYDMFSEFGEIKQIHLNLDRRTGYVKGYSMIEYETFKEAQAAIDGATGQELLEQEIKVAWAFKKPPHRGAEKPRRAARRRKYSDE